MGMCIVGPDGEKFRAPHTVRAGYAGPCDFNKAPVGVLCRDTRGSAVEELCCSSGLCVRKMSPSWWNVVHKASGKAVIAGAHRKWQAIKGAKKLAGLANWRQSELSLFEIFSNSEAKSLALSLILIRTTTKELANRGGSLAHKKRDRKRLRPVNFIKGMTRKEWEMRKKKRLI